MRISSRYHRLFIFDVKRTTKIDGMGPFKLGEIFTVFHFAGYRMDCGSTVMEESEPLMQQNEANIIVSSHSDASPTSKITSNDTDHDVPPQAGTPETGSSPHGALNQVGFKSINHTTLEMLCGFQSDLAKSARPMFLA